jgi:hypothetical protein
LWKEGLNWENEAEVSKRVADKLDKSYTEAITTRRNQLKNSIGQLRALRKMPNCSLFDEKVYKESLFAVALANSTLFEARVHQGMRYSALARKKHLKEHLRAFLDEMAVIGTEFENMPAPHPSIVKLCDDNK